LRLLHPLSSASPALRLFPLTPSHIEEALVLVELALITAAFIALAFIVAVSIAVVSIVLVTVVLP
jgi:hypothetical protein